MTVEEALVVFALLQHRSPRTPEDQALYNRAKFVLEREFAAIAGRRQA